MYLLVNIPDDDRVSEAIAVLLEKGFNQLTTGKEMKDVCSDCQSRSQESQATGNPKIVDTRVPGEVFPELFKTEERLEEPKEEGIAAEDLFANVKEEDFDSGDIYGGDEAMDDDYDPELDPGQDSLEPSTSEPKAIDRQEYGVSQDKLIENKKRREAILKAKKALIGVGTQRVELLSRHLMRMQRANKDGTSIYYCYFRNRASACCPGAYRIYRDNGSIEVLVPHNHAPNDELNRVELIKSQQKEMAKDKPHLNPKAIIQESWSRVRSNDKKQIGTLLGSYDCQRKRIERARRSLAQKETTQKFWSEKMEETGANFLRLGAFRK